MLLTELFTQPAEVTITGEGTNSLEGMFTVGNQQYRIEAQSIPIIDQALPDHIKRVWVVGFSTTDERGRKRYGITGTGKASMVFATAFEFVRKAIQTKDIQAIMFSAVKDEPSRIKMYSRLVSFISKKFGWKTMIEEGSLNIEYYVFKEEQ